MKKILIVDDDAGILECLRFFLESEGYIVTTAHDGAVFAKKMNDAKPDVIILDYRLPKENGGEIVKKLKQEKETRDIPVLMISANFDVKKICKEAGADDFLAKPFDMDELLGRVQTLTNSL